MAPGLSGASVFRVEASGHEYVLKLYEVADRWKAEYEIESYGRVPASAGNYRKHKPEIKLPRFPSKGLPKAVEFGTWYAICFDYLGGQKFGKFLDLRTALTGSLSEIGRAVRESQCEDHWKTRIESDPRQQLLQLLLNWLSKAWCRADGLAKHGESRIWNFSDAPPKEYRRFPPYQLMSKVKGRIIGFLEDPDTTTLGERFVPHWGDHKKRVCQFIEGTGVDKIAGLKGELDFVLSPAHGDLNSNNAFLWLDYPDHPFLIDFPMFQLEGHALQDFARLEVEIKFALMDRQTPDPPVRGPEALDLTWTQMELWIEMEAHLLSGQWNHDRKLSKRGFKENVALSLRHIQLIREKAKAVQEQPIAGRVAAEFMAEYRPALLYHTLRAITYNLPSPFKRLLATYSASGLLQKLGAS